MANFVFYLAILFLVFLPQQSHSQNTADSLHTILKKAEEPKKGELNLELARHFLPTHQDSCIYYSRMAQTIAKKTNNHTITIRSYALIGEAYQKQNKMKEALASYQEGLKLAEKHNEKSLAGNIYNGIGTCYFYMNDPKRAEHYLEQAAQAKKEANDYQYYSFIAANLAALQIMNQSFNEAIKTLKEAEKTLIKNKQDEYLATVYNSLGAAYQGTKSDSCVYYYEKGLELSKKNKNYLNMMTTHQNLGDYYLEKKNYPKAVEYMKNAIAVNELRPEDQYKPMLFERMSVLYESIGDFKNAFHYKKLETETRQRLLAATNKKEIEELEIKYQSEKKEKEIQLHKHEIEKAKSRQNLLLFGTISLFLIAGFVTYLIFQRRKITRKFEQEKLRLFENILHEIKTPLTLIEGPIQIMKQRSDASNNEQLGLMERNSKKLMGLVDELLDTSKLRKGSFQLHYTTGSIDDFIENTTSNFTSEAQSKDIQIVHTKNNIEKHYSFPSNALEKILSNLIGNAVKYCPAKSEIQITSQVEGDNLAIRISDTGPGIPKDEQRKVFRRFFRGKQATDVNGTGIGLSLVKELVELAKGTISMQSSPAGTLFDVSIPVQEFNTAIDSAQNNDAPMLLLAEDDQDTAAFSMAVLKENFQVIHAKNGREAMGLIRENLPDIVLSDIMMPEKDGLELLQEIKADELTSHLPVVLFSAQASLESRLKGLQHGADAYIAKPFSPEELKLTIGNLFATIQKNKEAYKEAIHSEKIFEERVKSQNAYVNRIIGYIISNIDNQEYSVNDLSDNMAVSRSQLHRKLVALTGFSTTNFISMIRLEKAKDLLSNNEGNITEIAYKCGFSSQSYFTKSFTEYFGKSPSQMLKNQ